MAKVAPGMTRMSADVPAQTETRLATWAAETGSHRGQYLTALLNWLADQPEVRDAIAEICQAERLAKLNNTIGGGPHGQ